MSVTYAVDRLMLPSSYSSFKLQQLQPPGFWVGHLDHESPRLGQGWPRETGNARVCLHNLNLDHKLPLGTPLAVGQRLEILRGNEPVGSCVGTRVVDGARQKIDLCRPVASSFFDERQRKLSRRET